MKPYDTVTANIITDSQEMAHRRDTLDRREFLTRLAASVGGIGVPLGHFQRSHS